MVNSLKSGVCPKCGGTEVYFTERSGHKIVPHDFREDMGSLMGRRPSPIVDNFVCGICGYVEFFVRPREIETVKKNWDRLKPQ